MKNTMKEAEAHVLQSPKSEIVGETERIARTLKLDTMTISQIASVIQNDWGKHVWYGAKPYLQAMFSLEKITDNYYLDSGESVVAYFLANAQTWKGEVARAVKKELNRRLK